MAEDPNPRRPEQDDELPEVEPAITGQPTWLQADQEQVLEEPHWERPDFPID